MKLKFCLNEYNLPKVILVLFFVLYGYVPYILDHDLVIPCRGLLIIFLCTISRPLPIPS